MDGGPRQPRRVVLATKVGSKPDRTGLGADNIAAAAEDSLARLQTDRVDLYYTHRDDPATPLEESLGALDALVREGKVAEVAASNYSADAAGAALAVQDRDGLARFVGLQPQYNLLERAYEAELAPLLAREGLACLPYSALASGFLTGKYLDGPRRQPAGEGRGEVPRRPRPGGAHRRGEVADRHGTHVAAVAVAWLSAQPTVLAPLVSARSRSSWPRCCRRCPCA